ncbi:hypothetical protein OG195_27200 [Streptomyces sp. NBC_01362]|uniref:hypothetical protein n=1 Tax=Streptomyces sp. NBC_01362 TaxID=2903839 RepID=UPI002E353C3D|nr:hypothetical protein [Streptomyces sp. NBC_01362]
MELSPAGQDERPGHNRSTSIDRSLHSTTDAMLVATGGTAFVMLAIVRDADAWQSIEQSVALTVGLRLALSTPAGAARAWSKIRRFMRS